MLPDSSPAGSTCFEREVGSVGVGVRRLWLTERSTDKLLAVRTLTMQKKKYLTQNCAHRCFLELVKDSKRAVSLQGVRFFSRDGRIILPFHCARKSTGDAGKRAVGKWLLICKVFSSIKGGYRIICALNNKTWFPLFLLRKRCFSSCIAN